MAIKIANKNKTTLLSPVGRVVFHCLLSGVLHHKCVTNDLLKLPPSPHTGRLGALRQHDPEIGVARQVIERLCHVVVLLLARNLRGALHFESTGLQSCCPTATQKQPSRFREI